MKAVKQDIADTINNLHALLKRDFGCDYSFQVVANGHTVAKSNSTGVVPPTPIPEAPTAGLT